MACWPHARFSCFHRISYKFGCIYGVHFANMFDDRPWRDEFMMCLDFMQIPRCDATAHAYASVHPPKRLLK